MPVYASRQPVATTPVSGRSTSTAIVGGIAASLVLAGGMLLLRSTASVRTIPERLLEWLLLFVPPGVFETTLQQFGFDAKRYGLDAAVLAMLAAFAGLGYQVLRRGWPVPAIALLGPGAWLVVMLVVMPLTSAGVFATALLDGTAAAVLGYLAVCLSYAAVLAVARVWPLAGDGLDSLEGLPARDRRTLLAVIGGSAVAYLATYTSGLLLPASTRAPSILLVDPQEPVASGGLDEPNAHPQAVSSPITQSQPLGPAPTAAVSASPGLPEPGEARGLQRDKDGAVLPSGRAAGQLAPALTANHDFYIVTKNAGGDPILHPDNWHLLVDGEVQRSFQLDYATLRRLPAVEVTKTLECISNFVSKPELAPFGAELISTARWKGVPVRDILALTGGPKPGAGWLAVLSADEFISALPIAAAMDPATLLVYEMNGEVLPREHGYPARLLVPGRYGMKNPKWVVGLRPTSRDFLDWYGQRNWSKDAFVMTMTRVDSPAPGAQLNAGQNTLSGVAYAGARGIKRVEYSSDGGEEWQTADVLEPAAGQDAWVRWRGAFAFSAGTKVTLLARATDGKDVVQEEGFRLPQPNGGTGWPRVEIG